MAKAKAEKTILEFFKEQLEFNQANGAREGLIKFIEGRIQVVGKAKKSGEKGKESEEAREYREELLITIENYMTETVGAENFTGGQLLAYEPNLGSPQKIASHLRFLVKIGKVERLAEPVTIVIEGKKRSQVGYKPITETK